MRARWGGSLGAPAPPAGTPAGARTLAAARGLNCRDLAKQPSQIYCSDKLKTNYKIISLIKEKVENLLRDVSVVLKYSLSFSSKEL